METETLNRDQYVYLARLSEQAERYKEMVYFMEKLVVGSSSVSELTVEERNLLSVAYKNVIESLRAARRILSSIEQNEESRKNEKHLAIVKDYRSKVESELSDVCAGMLKLLDAHLIHSSSESESKVFYLKMKGDYHRYLAELKVGDERKEAAEGTMLAYKAAQDIVVAHLPAMHLIRLDLALNYSLFNYEIMNSSKKVCSMAKQDDLANIDNSAPECSTTMMDEFNIINEVGSGAFDAVFAAERKKNLEIVAIKKVRIHDNVITNHLAREIVLLADIRHPHLLRMLELPFIHEGHLCFVLEYLSTTLMEHVLTYSKKYPELAKSILQQILAGVSHCHSLGVLHRDMKPENVLLNTANSSPIVKIADFGLARAFVTSDDAQLSPEVVTLNYKAPELLLGTGKYSKAIDIWSIGCMFAEMVIQGGGASDDNLSWGSEGWNSEGWNSEGDQVVNKAEEELENETNWDGDSGMYETDCNSRQYKLFFEGESERAVLNAILRIMGTPDESSWPEGAQLLANVEKYPPQDLAECVTELDSDGVDLLQKLLILNPENRISAEDALKHRYFNSDNT